MARVPSRRQRVLLTIVIASIVIVVADVIAVNIAEDDLFDVVSWTLAVTVGLLLVPIVGIVSFVMWMSERTTHTP